MLQLVTEFFTLCLVFTPETNKWIIQFRAEAEQSNGILLLLPRHHDDRKFWCIMKKWSCACSRQLKLQAYRCIKSLFFFIESSIISHYFYRKRGCCCIIKFNIFPLWTSLSDIAVAAQPPMNHAIFNQTGADYCLWFGYTVIKLNPPHTPLETARPISHERLNVLDSIYNHSEFKPLPRWSELNVKIEFPQIHRRWLGSM